MILSYKPIVEIYTKFNNDLKKSFEEQEFNLIETQNIVLSNEILTRKESDKLISSIDILIKKLQKPTLSVHFFNCFKITKKTMSLTMFITWILTEYFHAYRNVEP
uniref:Uncharacterized protein n=1 Tax=Acrobeloides nanus TaxID=290746 RepID=A0A914E7X0_9BILA